VSSGVDAVVVGGGIIGSGVALELARRGATVLLCEQGRVPGRGATSWSGGLIRQHHTAHCDTRLAVDSLVTFQQWPELVGGDCGYRRTGFVQIVAGRHAENLRHNVAAVNEAGGVSEIVDLPALLARYPALAFDDAERAGVLAAYEPEGGYVDPLAASLSLLAAAVRLGARCGEGITVTELTTAGDRITGVQTNVGKVSASTVVLAAGAWSARLAAGVGQPVPVTPRRIGIGQVDFDLADGSLPIGIDDTLGTYFRPVGKIPGDGMYFRVGTTDLATVDEVPPPITIDELAVAQKTICGRVPMAGVGMVTGTRAGFDGYTPDEHPVIGAAGPAGLFLCTGFSGGGVKMAPAVARLLADEVVNHSASALLAPYRPHRFTAGALIESEYPYDYM